MTHSDAYYTGFDHGSESFLCANYPRGDRHPPVRFYFETDEEEREYDRGFADGWEDMERIDALVD